jgi:hypothetical protein
MLVLIRSTSCTYTRGRMSWRGFDSDLGYSIIATSRNEGLFYIYYDVCATSCFDFQAPVAVQETRYTPMKRIVVLTFIVFWGWGDGKGSENFVVQAFSLPRLSPSNLSCMMATTDSNVVEAISSPMVSSENESGPYSSLTSTFSRRLWLRNLSAAAFSSVATKVVWPAGPAWALKPRNEALCGTGLFTNFLEYRCTDLGDISDEGQKTSFSNSNEAVPPTLC